MSKLQVEPSTTSLEQQDIQSLAQVQILITKCSNCNNNKMSVLELSCLMCASEINNLLININFYTDGFIIKIVPKWC